MDIERYERVREHLDNCPDIAKSMSPARVKTSPTRASNAWRASSARPPIGRRSHRSSPRKSRSRPTTMSRDLSHPAQPPETRSSGDHPRDLISNIFNSASAGARAFLRRGEMPPAPDPAAPQKAFLISVPSPCDGLLRGHGSGADARLRLGVIHVLWSRTRRWR